MGYTCSLRNSQFSLYLNSNIIGTGSLYGFDNLYLLNIIASYYETLHVSSHGTKRKLTNENSTTLWHKRLGHISKNRIERHMSNGILDSLEFTDFTICVECIKGKQIKNKRLGANRASKSLRTYSNTYLWVIPQGILEWSTIFYFIHRQLFYIWIPIAH